jgi:hypothetical protein
MILVRKPFKNMANLQTQFTAEATKIKEEQDALQDSALERIAELEVRKLEEQGRAEAFAAESAKAQTFITNITKLFE